MTDARHTPDNVGASQGKGASLRDRATHEQSQQAVSAVPVGIPSAVHAASILFGRAERVGCCLGIGLSPEVALGAAAANMPDGATKLSVVTASFETAAFLDATLAGMQMLEERHAQAMSAREGQDPQGLGAKPASAVAEGHAPNPSQDHQP